MWVKKYSHKNQSDQEESTLLKKIDFSELLVSVEEEIKIMALEGQVNELTRRLAEVINQVKELSSKETIVTQYESLNVNVSNEKDVSLEIFKTLPEFDGNRNKYATWRTIVLTAMKLLENHKTSMRYYEALMIVRNKINGAASNVLNNFNTAFNLEAIIERLDFSYADKRALYVLEQELLIVQQNKLSIDEYYDKVNEKLNCIVNKINMTYKEPKTAEAFIEEANEKALRTFTTGLNNRRGEILYASNPKSLPEAYAKLQTIMNDQERIKFANQFNWNSREKNSSIKQFQSKNPDFEFRKEKFEKKSGNFNQKKDDFEEPMDIDKSSMNVNQGLSSFQRKQFKPGFKRENSTSNQNTKFSEQHRKFQRINNLDETKTIIEEEPSNHNEETILDDSEENDFDTSSIFLDE